MASELLDGTMPTDMNDSSIVTKINEISQFSLSFGCGSRWQSLRFIVCSFCEWALALSILSEGTPFLRIGIVR